MVREESCSELQLTAFVDLFVFGMPRLYIKGDTYCTTTEKFACCFKVARTRTRTGQDISSLTRNASAELLGWPHKAPHCTTRDQIIQQDSLWITEIKVGTRNFSHFSDFGKSTNKRSLFVAELNNPSQCQLKLVSACLTAIQLGKMWFLYMN